MLEVVSFVLGPVETNVYLVGDPHTREAVVIDPAWDGLQIAHAAKKHAWQITELWLTHAHFDHLAGAAALVRAISPLPRIGLHAADLPLYQVQGGASLFGMRIESGPEPDLPLAHGEILRLGNYEFEVRHAPGHTPGHVVFYCAAEKLVFCGDVIFFGGIGRTDLPGGSYAQLMHSIRSQILSLPDDTLLLSGHGPETTVGQERTTNPFLI